MSALKATLLLLLVLLSSCNARHFERTDEDSATGHDLSLKTQDKREVETTAENLESADEDAESAEDDLIRRILVSNGNKRQDDMPGIWGRSMESEDLAQTNGDKLRSRQVNIEESEDEEQNVDARPPGLWGREIDKRPPGQLWGRDLQKRPPGLWGRELENKLPKPPGLWGREIVKKPPGLWGREIERRPPGLWGREMERRPPGLWGREIENGAPKPPGLWGREIENGAPKPPGLWGREIENAPPKGLRGREMPIVESSDENENQNEIILDKK